MAFLKLFVLVVLCASVFAKVVVIRPCEGVSQDVCKVTEVRVNPCAYEKRCKIEKNKNVSISFDFTPNFNPAKPKTMVYALIGSSYQHFAGFGSDDACEYTSCPFEVGKSQTFNYNMLVKPKTPKGLYDLKWNVWNDENEQENCCFKMAIRIK